MGLYVLRRLLQVIPVLVGVSVVVFILLRLVPGDPAIYVAGPEASPEVLAAIRHDMGLDRSLPVQYALWAGHVLHGDFGKSFVNGIPVSTLIWQRIPATTELATVGLLFTVMIGLPLGIIAAVKRGGLWEYLIGGFSALGLGVPVFLWGVLLIVVFAQNLRWVPPGGRLDPSAGILPWVKSLLLPAFTLGVANAASLTRYVRSAILETMYEDYVRTARSKGLPSIVILTRHVLRNALIPVITVIGIIFGRLLGGVVIVEAIFTWPGIGSMIITAIGNRDYSLVQTSLLLVVMAFALINLGVDVIYGWLDPRIRNTEAQ